MVNHAAIRPDAGWSATGAITGSAALASQMGRFETKWLSRPEDLAALADLSGQWIDKVQQQCPPRIVMLDMDSSASPTYSEQERSTTMGIRLHLLPPAVRIQPARRCGAVRPAIRQRAQRR
jgi:hypothetical protein